MARSPLMSYEEFRSRVEETLRAAGEPLEWKEIRKRAALPQKFPNNRWVRRLEQDLGLIREKTTRGIRWRLP